MAVWGRSNEWCSHLLLVRILFEIGLARVTACANLTISHTEYENGSGATLPLLLQESLNLKP